MNLPTSHHPKPCTVDTSMNLLTGTKKTEKIGVLITNLGTPDAPTKQALKVYLKEFLSDIRVVEPPPSRFLWKLILNLIILNVRPKRSAEAYKTVWGEFGDGSPLLDISIRQRDLLRDSLGDGYQVELGMRYGKPSIDSALQLFTNCSKIIVLPLYPQYAAATTGSTFDAIGKSLSAMRVVPSMQFISNYYQHPLYIDAMVASIKEHLADDEFLLFSYHGIPKRYFKNGDIYSCHCCETTNTIAHRLGLTSERFMMTYQSRFGREEWMKPYTDKTLMELPKQGITKIKVVCPGFSADCLETIEEINEENREYFLEAGGESYDYIPALNYREDHIQALHQVILES